MARFSSTALSIIGTMSMVALTILSSFWTT